VDIGNQRNIGQRACDNPAGDRSERQENRQTQQAQEAQAQAVNLEGWGLTPSSNLLKRYANIMKKTSIICSSSAAAFFLAAALGHGIPRILFASSAILWSVLAIFTVLSERKNGDRA
jgi:hypothetical protein